jgi:hypothetical protein
MIGGLVSMVMILSSSDLQENIMILDNKILKQEIIVSKNHFRFISSSSPIQQLPNISFKIGG